MKERLLDLLVNGKPCKLGKRVMLGDSIEIRLADPAPLEVKPENVALEVLFESEDVLVIDKPQGMVVHPGAGNRSGTLVQGLLFLSKSVRDNFSGNEARPGIVHRLDKETSGVIITAKSPEALETLSLQFRSRSTKKLYLAIVKGKPPRESGIIESFIVRDPENRKRFIVSSGKGKHAVTRYKVLKDFGSYAFLALRPETGRTHQLRVHMKAVRCPILGDPLYAKKDIAFPDASLMLHSYKLHIRLPGESLARTFTAPLPERFKQVLLKLAGR